MRMRHLLLFILVAASTGSVTAEEEVKPRGFSSPDKRFTLVIYVPSGSKDAKLIVADRASGKMVADLGTDYASIISQTWPIWSADSKRVAYRTGGEKEWHTNVWFWDGSTFRHAPLPEELPSPEINLARSDEHGGVKNHGGGEEPVRWLTSGDLELLSQQTQVAHDSGRTYTASMTITIGFDAQHRASVKQVSEPQTRIDDALPRKPGSQEWMRVRSDG